MTITALLSVPDPSYGSRKHQIVPVTGAVRNEL